MFLALLMSLLLDAKLMAFDSRGGQLPTHSQLEVTVR
jgi:hypothetical protein